MSEKSVVRWLLEGDPAIRWQTMRDLAGEPNDVVERERARVAHEGWGRALLDRQAPQGWWSGPDEEGWMITMDALALLREFGADPDDERVRRAVDRVQQHLRFAPLGDRPFFEGETEACINGSILASASYFGIRSDALADQLLDEQLDDGGWNCDAPPSTRASFNSTIRVLEGLLEYERRWEASTAISAARARAHEYLLERSLLRRRSNGEIISRKWTRFTFPTMWHYDVLRALDYFRDADAPRDERMAEAVGIVEARRHQNARWPMNHLHADRLQFPIEPEIARASRWITMRAMRVLRWWRSEP